MHIADGVVTNSTILVVSTISLLGFIYSLKKIKQEHLTLASAMSAMFFIASFIHIPVGISQIHLLLIGVIGVVIGWGSVVSISLALFLQAFLLGYGGIVSLGINVFIMATPAIIVFYLYNLSITKKLNKRIKYFLVGFLGTFLSTLFLALILLFAKDEYEFAAYSIFGINIVTMLVEGVISMFLLSFIEKVYPKVLK